MKSFSRREVLGGLVVVGAGFAPLGCASSRPPPVDFSDTSRSYQPTDYDRVRDVWTRHDKLVRDIGTVLEVWVTFKSADFRQAYVEQYASIYGLGPEERRELRNAQLEAARTNYEFHVVAQSTEWKWVDLDHRDSVWKIALVDGSGHEIAPSQVSLEKLPELYEMKFFPIRTDFSRSYTMRFPHDGGGKFAGTATGQLSLKVAGPLGAAVTSWEAGH